MLRRSEYAKRYAPRRKSRSGHREPSVISVTEAIARSLHNRLISTGEHSDGRRSTVRFTVPHRGCWPERGGDSPIHVRRSRPRAASTPSGLHLLRPYEQAMAAQVIRRPALRDRAMMRKFSQGTLER